MTTRTYIKWTSRQQELVVAALVNVFKQEFAGHKLRHPEDRVGSSWIRSSLPRAQQVLDQDYRRQHFTKEHVHQLNIEVSQMIWRLQLEHEKSQLLLQGAPLDSLLEEIARRNQDQLLEQLLDRLEGPLLMKMMERLDKAAETRFNLIEQRLKHNPTVERETRKVIPSYVVTGLPPNQETHLRELVGDACKLTIFEADAKTRVSVICKDKIVFTGKYVGHSTYETAKQVAAKTTFCNGGAKEVARMILHAVKEFNELQQAQGEKQ